MRLAEPTPVALNNRLLCLVPFRAMLTLGKTQITMLGGTEIRILPQSTDEVPAIELVQGRVLLRKHPAGSVKVGVSDRVVSLELPADSGAALERLVRLDYGRILTPSPPLVIYCTTGELSVSIDQKQETLTASDALSISSGGIKRGNEDTSPPWATDAEPPADERTTREKFAKMFHSGRPVLTEIVTASEDESPDMRVLSIIALKSLGDMSFLMPMLSRKNDPVVRRTALAPFAPISGSGRTRRAACATSSSRTSATIPRPSSVRC